VIALSSDGFLRGRARPSPWTVAATALAAAFLVVLAFRLFDQAPADAIHEAMSEGRPAPAPAFDLEVLTAGDLGGTPPRWWRMAQDGRVSLRELRGSPVVINFWTSRCIPCREEARVLERAAREVGRDVLLLGIGTAESAQLARDRVHALGSSFPQVHDSSGETARRWGVHGVPETFFLTADGDIVGHVVGAATAGDLQRGVAAAVEGRPAGLRTGGRRNPVG
jgi:cytochrome c biogenesis protein CcmG/thiol:disulfide interchange protein DsbE